MQSNDVPGAIWPTLFALAVFVGEFVLGPETVASLLENVTAILTAGLGLGAIVLKLIVERRRSEQMLHTQSRSAGPERGYLQRVLWG